jgi:EmrB/QacA subfamily drug resistance transporter
MPSHPPSAVAVAEPGRALEPGAASPPVEAEIDLRTLLMLLCGAFLPISSFFVINVALPSIGTDLHASPAALQLVVGAYGIANAVLVVVGGRLGDGFGRRRLFLLGMAGFTVFSLLCGLAPSVQLLLAARVGQGATAALMTPQVLATIMATMSGGQRGRAIGMFGAAGGVAAAAGQVVGGVLVSSDVWGLGWRSVFLIYVPVGLLALAAAWRRVPESKADVRIPVDVVGATLLALTLVLLLLPATEGRPLGWPVWVFVVLAATLPAAVLWFGHQRRTERSGRVPLVPPSVLGLRQMQVGLLIGFLFFTSFGGFMFVFALATQGEAGLSAFEGGLTLTPLAATFLLVSIYGPALQTRWGAGIITRGWIVQAVGYVLLAADVHLVWPDVTPLNLATPMLVIGLGNGMVMMPLFGVVLSQVPPAQAGLGSGILITLQQTCLALGAAAIGTMYLTWADGSIGQGGALVGVSLLITAVSVLALPPSRALAH